MFKNNTVLTMAVLRVISGLLELGAALLIIRLGKVESALRINGVLAIIGPTLLLIGLAVGVAGLSDRMPTFRMVLIYCGALMIFLGTRR